MPESRLYGGYKPDSRFESGDGPDSRLDGRDEPNSRFSSGGFGQTLGQKVEGVKPYSRAITWRVHRGFPRHPYTSHP